MERIKQLPASLLSGGVAWVALALVVSMSLAGCDNAAPSPTASEIGNGPDTQATATPDPGASRAGITAERILFGQSAAFSGPAQDLGLGMMTGIQAAFNEANLNGGVHGRQLALVSEDDSYEPEAAIANTLSLIRQEEVFALIGAVGTPTSRSATPVAERAGVPYIAPFTGAAFLRDPEWSTVLNLRASYNQETEEMVARLVGDLGIERIAVLYQDDSYGRAGFNGVTLALDKRGMEPVAIGLYPRNTTAVKTGLLDLRQGEPEAVIMIGAYEPVARVVAWARELEFDPVFMTVSFVGSNALARELGPRGEGVFVTQVVPFPMDNSIPVVSRYIHALAVYDTGAVPGFVSLEGYLAGRLAIASLEKCGREVDRDCFLNSLRSDEVIDIDGFQLSYGAQDNQGSDAVFLTVIGPDGLFRSVDTLNEAEQ